MTSNGNNSRNKICYAFKMRKQDNGLVQYMAVKYEMFSTFEYFKF